MGRKERSNIVRIQKTTRAHQRKFTITLQDIARQSVPGEWHTEIIEHPPSVPCGDEYNALQEILNTTSGVFWKPRKRKEYIVDSSDLRKFQILGFEHYADFVGYSQTNGLSHLTQDFDILFDDKENNNE